MCARHIFTLSQIFSCGRNSRSASVTCVVVLTFAGRVFWQLDVFYAGSNGERNKCWHVLCVMSFFGCPRHSAGDTIPLSQAEPCGTYTAGCFGTCSEGWRNLLHLSNFYTGWDPSQTHHISPTSNSFLQPFLTLMETCFNIPIWLVSLLPKTWQKTIVWPIW